MTTGVELAGATRATAGVERGSRLRILDAALELFSEHGFDGASVRQIADAAGVSKALVHRHFPTKDAILTELLADFTAQLAEMFTRVYAKTDCDRYYGCWDTAEIWEGLEFFIENRRSWALLMLESLTSSAGRASLIQVWDDLNANTRNKMLEARGFTIEGDPTKDIVDLFFIFMPTVCFAVFQEDWRAIRGGAAQDVARSFSRILNTQYSAFLRTSTRDVLVRDLITAQEDERQRIALELHDETSQALTGLMLALDATELALETGRGDARAQVAAARSISQGMLEGINRLTTDLRPSVLDDLGLIPAVARQGEQRLRPVGIELRLLGTGLGLRLPSPIETALFRIIQEALTNVVRHARASTVEVRLDVDDDGLRLEVRDDGRGIDPRALEGRERHGDALGLRGMRERVAMLDGEFALATGIGHGVAIEVRLPIPGADVR